MLQALAVSGDSARRCCAGPIFQSFDFQSREIDAWRSEWGAWVAGQKSWPAWNQTYCEKPALVNTFRRNASGVVEWVPRNTRRQRHWH